MKVSNSTKPVEREFIRAFRPFGIGAVLTDKVRFTLQQNPLAWALPLQAFLLLLNLDLLDPWNDEWFTLTIVPEPLSQLISTVAGVDHPPLYYVLLHYWVQLPWTVSPLASMRAMSATWTLVATVVIYIFWLRREGPGSSKCFLRCGCCRHAYCYMAAWRALTACS